MRLSLLTLILLTTFATRAQTVVIADPGYGGSPYPTNLSGTPIDANNLVQNDPVLLKQQIFNSHPSNAIPELSARVRINLGSRMIIDPSYVLASAPLSEYFSWSYSVSGGSAEITGEIISPLPPDFFGEASFRVIPHVLGTSTVTSNWNITNNNPSYILSDETPTNNFAQLSYTVVAAPVPVTFTGVQVQKKGCSILVNWGSENEINVNRYEIEVSKDGLNYYTVSTVTAMSRTNYTTQFALAENIRAASLFVRIRAVDHDGSYMFSETRSVAGICDDRLLFNIYPNPVIDQALTLKATSGLFNGKYNLSVLDMQGRLISQRQASMTNVAQYSYDLGGIANGKYLLRVSLSDGSDASVISFEKL